MYWSSIRRLSTSLIWLSHHRAYVIDVELVGLTTRTRFNNRVARRSNTVFTMLPSSPQVQAVYLGASGILEALHSHTPQSPVSAEQDHEPKIFIDSTTLDVHVARDVADDIYAAGAEMVDAPVSGGVVGAKAGTLSFMVGGLTSSFDRARPFLEHMGTRIVHCGDPGNGLIAKLCNNHILVRPDIYCYNAFTRLTWWIPLRRVLTK